MVYKVIDNGWAERVYTNGIDEALAVANRMLDDYRRNAHMDGEWNDEVGNIIIKKEGKIIGGASKIIIASRPDKNDMDEDGYCVEGYCWDHDDYDEVCDYEIKLYVK